MVRASPNDWDSETRMNRQQLKGIGGKGNEPAFAKTLSSIVRTGDDSELKSMSVGSDPDGG